MKGLLVRVGADQSEGGGRWNGSVDGATDEFAGVSIPDPGPLRLKQTGEDNDDDDSRNGRRRSIVRQSIHTGTDCGCR